MKKNKNKWRSITKTPCSRSESTTTSAIAKDETKSTILAHDDDNNADESAPCNAELRAKSVASPTTAYITANAKFGSRFKAKSDHSKYDIHFMVSICVCFWLHVFVYRWKKSLALRWIAHLNLENMMYNVVVQNAFLFGICLKVITFVCSFRFSV